MFVDSAWPASREAFYTLLLELVKQGKLEGAVVTAYALVDSMNEHFPIPDKETKVATH